MCVSACTNVYIQMCILHFVLCTMLYDISLYSRIEYYTRLYYTLSYFTVLGLMMFYGSCIMLYFLYHTI